MRQISHAERVRRARAESLRRFGPKPDPLAVLSALVDQVPGPTYRGGFVDSLVIEFAAARVVGRDIKP